MWRNFNKLIEAIAHNLSNQPSRRLYSPSPAKSQPPLATEQDTPDWLQALRADPNRPPEVCICACHDSILVHCLPCCSRCEKCHLPIRQGTEAEHMQRCGQYHAPLPIAERSL